MFKKSKYFVYIFIFCFSFITIFNNSNIFAKVSDDDLAIYNSFTKSKLEDYNGESLYGYLGNNGTNFQCLDLENGFNIDSLYEFTKKYYSSQKPSSNFILPDLETFKSDYASDFITIDIYKDNNNNVVYVLIEIRCLKTDYDYSNVSDSSYGTGENYFRYYSDCYYFSFNYYLKYGSTSCKPYTNFDVRHQMPSSDGANISIPLYDSLLYKINFDIHGMNNKINFTHDDDFSFLNSDKEVEIGDPSSRLKLSYEYNEDYTECHVNANLEGGSFTDRIFYSNYMPSIAGQGLLSKQSFPRERCNFKRKSVFIFSS